MKRFLIALVPMMMLVLATDAMAQKGMVAPESQLGIGVNTSGASVQYAFTPSIQAGVMLAIASTSTDGGSVTGFSFDPYLRVLFEGPINPFVEAGVSIQSTTTSPDGGVEVSESTTALFAGFGLEYYVTRNVGFFGTVQLLSLDLSRSSKSGSVTLDGQKQTTIGIVGGRAGVEYYFGG